MGTVTLYSGLRRAACLQEPVNRDPLRTTCYSWPQRLLPDLASPWPISQVPPLGCEFSFGFLSVCASVSDSVFYAYFLYVKDKHSALSFGFARVVPFTWKQNTNEGLGSWDVKGNEK